MDIWSWISSLPNSAEWSESDSPPTFQLTQTKPHSPKSIHLKAERTSGSNSETLVTFSICINGFHSSNAQKTLWISDACPLSSEKTLLPLLLQLIQEIITRSPTAHDITTCTRTHFPKLKPESASSILDAHLPESLSSFFNLIFLCRLFWLCCFDAPAEVGSVYFKSILGPNLDPVSCKQVLRTFLMSIGVDAELCVVRTLGYMLVKWLMLRGMGIGLQQVLTHPFSLPGFSYGMESHGLWILKGYAPVLSMTRTRSSGEHTFEANETVLKYALSHQQLEAVIQLEYSVSHQENHIQVKARVDNLRFHVVKLGFNKNEDGDYVDERYFPSRIRVWVGPEVGSTHVGGLSLGRSTENPGREVETQKHVKGTFGKSKVAMVKAKARTATRTKTRNWRCEQDAEGNVAIFEAILYDNMSGVEVATWKGANSGGVLKDFGKRHSKASRAFNKSGGLIMGGDEYGEEVGWRVSREMEGSVLKWRLGGKVWLSYCANELKTEYFETRCVEWCEEVELPLVPLK